MHTRWTAWVFGKEKTDTDGTGNGYCGFSYYIKVGKTRSETAIGQMNRENQTAALCTSDEGAPERLGCDAVGRWSASVGASSKLLTDFP